MQRRILFTLVAAAACLGAFDARALAEEITFDLVYSGAGSGNSAKGFGHVTFDDAVLLTDGVVAGDAATVGVVELELTISGAAEGNGTFGTADFDRFLWNLQVGTDLTTQLIGQDNFLDWNVFPPMEGLAPSGVAPNAIQTNGGIGDVLNLISMRPQVTPAAAKQARKDLAAASRAALGVFKGDVRTSLGALNDELKQAGAGLDPADPGGFLDAVVVAVAKATDLVLAAESNHSAEVDNAASGILDDLGQSALPGFVVGGGGEIDTYRAGIDKQLAKFSGALKRAVERTVRRARKSLDDDGVMTVQVFPVQATQPPDPGIDRLAIESSFYRSEPVLLLGYGDVNYRFAGVLGTAAWYDTQTFNIYDGDGLLLEAGTMMPKPTLRVFGGLFKLPQGAQVPHGNVRVEVFSPNSGWTFGLGY